MNKITEKLPIVVIDDEKMCRSTIELALRVAGYENISAFEKSSEALEWIRNNDCCLVVLDIVMDERPGTEVLVDIKTIKPDAAVIMVTGVAETDVAVKCLKNGAYDYIQKPLEAERLIASVSNAIDKSTIYSEYQLLTERMLSDSIANPGAFKPILTRNLRMQTIFKYIEAVASTKHPVLITGETGTGKELIAQAVHSCSGLDGKFIAINVAGLDDAMFSDVLFGHCKGAYTGAEFQRSGLVEAASNGTLFLDEIGDLTVQSQVKLLRLIQQREYFPIGSDTVRRCNARIVSATSKSITDLENPDIMRKDLFYRLRTHHIHLPALRERKDDLELLVNAFVERTALELNKQKPFIPRELYTLLATWHFPGNIRELEGVVYDAISVHQKGILSLAVFRERLNNENTAAVMSSNVCKEGENVVFNGPLPTLEEVENIVICEAVERANGNQSMAANLLGITRQSLSYRLKRLKRDDVSSE